LYVLDGADFSDENVIYQMNNDYIENNSGKITIF